MGKMWNLSAAAALGLASLGASAKPPETPGDHFNEQKISIGGETRDACHRLLTNINYLDCAPNIVLLGTRQTYAQLYLKYRVHPLTDDYTPSKLRDKLYLEFFSNEPRDTKQWRQYYDALQRYAIYHETCYLKEIIDYALNIKAWHVWATSADQEKLNNIMIASSKKLTEVQIAQLYMDLRSDNGTQKLTADDKNATLDFLGRAYGIDNLFVSYAAYKNNDPARYKSAFDFTKAYTPPSNYPHSFATKK